MYYSPPNKPETRRLLSNRGVPSHLFGLRSFNIDGYVREVDIPFKDGFIEFPVSRQLHYLQDVLKDPFSKSLTIIGGQFYATKAQAIALLIMRIAIQKRDRNRLPLWHYITGSFKDNLRDDDTYKLKIGTPGLLILDGITSTSSTVKFEKCHDLLELYGSIPKILICSGTDPVTIARNHIHTKPDGYLYISETKMMEI